MLVVENLAVSYRGVSALKGVSFTVHQGELVGLLGPNGGGKTTMLKAMLGLIPTQKGVVMLNRSPLKQQRQKIAYVPQRSQIDWDYPITAHNVVMLARTLQSRWFGSPSRQSREVVKEALQRVGMWELRQRQIGELSGGQQQRIFLARAIAQQAEIFLFDEPFTGIDKKTEAIIFNIFSELKAEGKMLLVSSHQWGDTLNFYDRLLLINQQLVAAGSPNEVITLDNIQQAYGEVGNRALVKSHVETFFYC